MIKLSIVIPTYNRVHLLIKVIDNLIPIIPEWCELIILDNDSLEIQKLFDKYSNHIGDGRIKYIKNRFNVGGNENLLRSFEYGSGEWVWVLGDDDYVIPNSFKRIKEIFNSIDPEVFLIHFNWENDHIYSNTKPISEFSDVFDQVASLGDINFCSSNLVRRDVFSKISYLLHFWQLTCSSNMLTLLIALEMNLGKVQFSNVEIVKNGFHQKDQSLNWDVELVINNITLIAFYNFNLNNKKILIHELNKLITIPIAIKASIRNFLKTKNRKISIVIFLEILKLKLIYGNLIYSFFIKSISVFLFMFFKPLSLLYLKLKNKKN